MLILLLNKDYNTSISKDVTFPDLNIAIFQTKNKKMSNFRIFYLLSIILLGSGGYSGVNKGSTNNLEKGLNNNQQNGPSGGGYNNNQLQRGQEGGPEGYDIGNNQNGQGGVGGGYSGPNKREVVYRNPNEFNFPIFNQQLPSNQNQQFLNRNFGGNNNNNYGGNNNNNYGGNNRNFGQNYPNNNFRNNGNNFNNQR